MKADFGHSPGIEPAEGGNGKGKSRRAKDKESFAPRLLSLEDAKIYLGLSYWTVRDYVDSGQLPTVKLPSARANDGRVIKRVLIDRRDLDQFVEKHKEKILEKRPHSELPIRNRAQSFTGGKNGSTDFRSGEGPRSR